MFAFLNGWAFAIDEATYRRAFRKIKKLLINYWCIAIPATIFAIWFCGYKTNAWLLVKILFGFDTALMIFAWYSDYTPLTLEEWVECDQRRRNKADR